VVLREVVVPALAAVVVVVALVYFPHLTALVLVILHQQVQLKVMMVVLL
jgi:hypothetical protein